MTTAEELIWHRALALRLLNPEYEGMFWSDLYPYQQEVLFKEAERQLREEGVI